MNDSSTSDIDERQRLLERHQQAMRRCSACVDAGHITQAIPIFHGTATSRVMVVGQAPALYRSERPLPYSGASGRTLKGWLERAGFRLDDLYERFYLTSLTKCFPGSSKSGKGDRAPSGAEIRLCRPHLERELALVRPELILALGRLSATYFVGNRPLSELVGEVFPFGDAQVLPLPHPSGVSHWLNTAENQALLSQALERLSEIRAARGL